MMFSIAQNARDDAGGNRPFKLQGRVAHLISEAVRWGTRILRAGVPLVRRRGAREKCGMRNGERITEARFGKLPSV